MTNPTCPACGHAFAPSASSAVTTPDPSVVQWFRVDPGWSGAMSTDDVYGIYLRAVDDPPVSRARFVADLAHLGVSEVLADETSMLVRP